MLRFAAFRLVLLLLLATLAGGCGGASSVSGTVTYEGEPLPKGQILFLPADGKGPSAGAAIVQGKYTINNLTPGPKTVQIVATPESAAPPVMSLEEMAKKGPTGSALPDLSAKLIPPNAEGNNASIQVNAGNSVLDFHLKKAANAEGK